MEKKKILLIDDEKDFAELVKMRLENSGDYDVKVLSSAKGVIEQVHAFEPDVILLDLLMPEMGGLEICEMLDDDAVGLGIPLIVVSGLDNEVDKVRAYKCGVADYLVKPIDPGTLIRSIEKAIRDKRGE